MNTIVTAYFRVPELITEISTAITKGSFPTAALLILFGPIVGDNSIHFPDVVATSRWKRFSARSCANFHPLNPIASRAGWQSGVVCVVVEIDHSVPPNLILSC